MDEAKLRATIASRLSSYRKLNGYTQLEIAEKLNYTDKSVSKWERGDGVPDIFVLASLAEIYSVTVNDLISEQSEPEQLVKEKKRLNSRSKTLIAMLSIGLAWLVAVLTFFGIKLGAPDFGGAWLVYICALPVSMIVAVVFASLWGNLLHQFITISGLIWSLAITISLCCKVENILWIYLVAAVVWVLLLLWILLRKQNYNIESLLHKRQEQDRDK